MLLSFNIKSSSSVFLPFLSSLPFSFPLPSPLSPTGGGGGGGMIKKTRDDAVYVTGVSLDTTFENVRDTFSSVGNIKVCYGRGMGGARATVGVVEAVSSYALFFAGGSQDWSLYDKDV